MPTARTQTPRILLVAAALAARDRSWTRAVLAGDPRTIDVLDELLRAGGVATTTISADLEGLRTDPVAWLDSALGTAASLRC